MLATILALALLAAACGDSAGGGGAGGAGTEGQEQAAFDRPVDMIIPFGPGGGADQVARAATVVMEKELGAQMPAINVPGATGSTGITRMTTAPPGTAVSILIQDTLSTVPFGSASFEMDQLIGVCRLQEMPSALMVRKGTFESWEDLAAAAKERPGELKVATVGQGGIDDVMLAALAELEGTEFRPVPFPEPTERYAALLGGAVDALYEQLGDVRENLDSGDFVPVLVFSEEPVTGFEDVPLASEVGIEESLPQFRGIVTRADTDPAQIEALSGACAEVTEDDKFADFQEQVYSTEDSYMPADVFQTFLDEQEAKIGELMRQYGIIE
ncbi:MAG: tripartite tricarboxylate transporter substrate binding protein [Egibacteraceae bacterium]